MEISVRGLWTLIHGMGFGALYLLGCSGLLVELFRGEAAAPVPGRFLRIYLLGMVVVAWFAVLSGTYVVYPWYRAALPKGATDLTQYPQRLLLASPATAGWHSLGMEWKEHVAWFVPIAMTMVAFVAMRYGSGLRAHSRLRAAVLGFAVVSFGAAGVAGFFGAMIDKVAPVQGGGTIVLSGGGER